MKLYYSPGACSLAAHIVAREAGLAIDLVRVDLASRRTKTGEDYFAINPRGYVPAIVDDDGEVHTEAAALVQYLAEQAPQSDLAPPIGSKERLRVNQWLAFVASELHKTFSPWLWDAQAAESTKQASHGKLGLRFAELDRHLATSAYLTGDAFTIADAYAFTIVNWSNFLKIDLTPYPNLSAYMARIAARPKVHEALMAEGLVAAAHEETAA
ncbi:glutathione transferase GstA [Pseudorhodoplanes sinuspersici]|uniref:Glutathione transferase GstA n=1 Tax=Pseudorhodoplanes sinuspersici TaxID=1235591 RepID=A0A1W6ZMT5_9HYPH|nr:glutathione transferase GstA [Pseudorhodoplanes sinuspersici]ARP98585.1 glutathione transferase GstA [Pseudorhodoplanes sinuspersici]RKE69837.1 glutathione S-transferase [Pseudorhodoplanes sinuspersici]